MTRLLQTHPEEGLEAAMLAYAPLVKAVLNRILPQNPCDREECMADVFCFALAQCSQAGAHRNTAAAVAHCHGAQQGHRPLQRPAPPRGASLDDGLAETLGELAEFDRATADAADLVGALVAAMAPPDRDIFLRKYYLLQSGKGDRRRAGYECRERQHPPEPRA